MHKLLLCLVALVACASAGKIIVQHHPAATITDMDRMTYDGLFALEQQHPEALDEPVHPEDVVHLLESSLGSDWRELVEIDESQPISFLELVRLSTSVTFKHQELAEQEKARRGFDGDEGHEADAYPNICMCHGTFHSTYASANGGATNSRGTAPFRGVRVLQKGGTYYGNNPYPKGLPQDCLLCEGLTNCYACCHGPCTIGTPADYSDALDNDNPSGTDWPLGLYPCPDTWTFDSSTGSPVINDVSACSVEVNTCAEAVALCSCSQKRHLMQSLGCDCAEVMVLCDDCFSAWDAIDKYKHCDCLDYARHYQN